MNTFAYLRRSTTVRHHDVVNSGIPIEWDEVTTTYDTVGCPPHIKTMTPPPAIGDEFVVTLFGGDDGEVVGETNVRVIKRQHLSGDMTYLIVDECPHMFADETQAGETQP